MGDINKHWLSDDMKHKVSKASGVMCFSFQKNDFLDSRPNEPLTSTLAEVWAFAHLAV